MGYAFLEDESEEERAALQRRLEKTFGTDHLLYLAGDKEDVENAKKAGKSLGIYLAEQILAGENFHKVVNEATEEEVLELLEKNPCSMTDQRHSYKDGKKSKYRMMPQKFFCTNFKIIFTLFNRFYNTHIIHLISFCISRIPQNILNRGKHISFYIKIP